MLSGPVIRIGSGFDIHRLVSGNDSRSSPLLLAGVQISTELHVLADSDGDVLFHAIRSALRAAVPVQLVDLLTSDTRIAEAQIRQVLEVMRSHGWRMGNLSAIVLLERPLIGHLMTDIVDKLASVLSVPADDISVQPKSNEGLDSIGAGIAVSCHVVLTIARAARQ